MSDLTALYSPSRSNPDLVPHRRRARGAVALAFVLAAASTFCIPPDCSAVDCVSYEKYLHPMGVVEAPVGLGFCAVSGTHAYVTDWEQTFHVIDVADPNNPRLVGSMDGPVRLWNVAVQGTYAYVTTWDSARLYVIDVSVPEAPHIVGSVNLPGWSFGVAVSGSYAYVACGDLQVIDITDPEHPRIVGGLGTPGGAAGVALSGTLAYVADWDSGLVVADISDPLHPHIIGSIDTPESAWIVTVSGTIACVGEYDTGYGTGGLNVIDVADPRNPRLLHRVGSLGTIYSASMSGRLACVTHYGTNDTALLVFDFTDPGNPSLVETFTFPYYYPIGVTFAPSPASGRPFAYLSGAISYDPLGSEGWFQTVAVSDIHHPDSLGSVHIPCCGSDVAVAGAHAFIAAQSSGLQVIDFADVHNPAVVGAVDTPDYALSVALDEGHAYVADNHAGLQVIDIEDPEAPRIVGNVAIDGAGAVALSGAYACVANGTFGLRVCDVSDPENPRIVGTADTPDFAGDVAVSGGFAYVADWRSGLQVIDVSHPDRPEIVGSLDTPAYAMDVAISRDHAYLVTTSPDLQLYVIDVADPRNPTISGRMSIMDWGSMTVSGAHLYLANYAMGIQIINVSDPERPRADGYIAPGGSPASIAVSASGILGLYGTTFRIFPRQCEPKISPRMEDLVSMPRPGFTAAPNPITSGAMIHLSMPPAGAVRAVIWDVTGRLVRTLCDGVLPAAGRDIFWDGRGNDGRAVAAGIYWIRVSTLEGCTTERLVVIR